MSKASQDYNLFLIKTDPIKEGHPTRNGNLRPRDVTQAPIKNCDVYVKRIMNGGPQQKADRRAKLSALR